MRRAAKRASTTRRAAFFVVVGRPITQGSLTSFTHPRTGRIVTPQSRPLLEWREKIAAIAMMQRVYLARPAQLDVMLDFWLDRGQRADIDKLARAVLDALTGVMFEDDVQVINLTARKRVAEAREPHVTIRVQESAA